MGGKASKDKTLTFGSFKVTARELHAAGVIHQQQGELQLVDSKDLFFRISSYERGVFHIRGKFLGSYLEEFAFKHQYFIELIHGSQVDEAWKKLAERYKYDREHTRIPFGRSIWFDLTKLLPYLYTKFAGQDLVDDGERFMQESHMRRLNSMSQAVRKAEQEQLVWHEQDMQKAVMELEELERGLRITTVERG
ncbi:hypothetical protein PTSG_08153 [Salpingoeca rosetta]|uniref:Uncharacterized protein n=1 Tax=Salpingoeca rosetta (strain ATCC 50818 / BSB-021) TaxID=946362 RepID=F2UI54_SALR5|nr:uncharacterized protein PTSG_08153 [Salpingoeca rosetta]EGD76803.1 hypothetical protein PTSG_08153 [Salpingoeca rosetta]|eukprot:XP_004991175.1 hypothetical protein PTSG_08153 [Salpingoeca rosetta]